MTALLDGKVAQVTAAGAGIGRSSAIMLALAGASVMVSDLDADTAERTAAEIRAAGGTARSLRLDIGEETDIAAGIAATVDAFGGLDILHNNASDTRMVTMLADRDVCSMDTALWDHILRVNLRGTMLCCKYGIPEMFRRGGGSIINTASLGGMLGMDALSGYAAAKAGVIQLTRSVATQYGKHGIRCNAIAPGVILTDTARGLYNNEQLQTVLGDNLTPYIGAPEDIASAVLFLASDQSRYITGHVLPVDGGNFAHAHGHGGGVAPPAGTQSNAPIGTR